MQKNNVKPILLRDTFEQNHDGDWILLVQYLCLYYYEGIKFSLLPDAPIDQKTVNNFCQRRFDDEMLIWRQTRLDLRSRVGHELMHAFLSRELKFLAGFSTEVQDRLRFQCLPIIKRFTEAHAKIHKDKRFTRNIFIDHEY